MFEVFNVVQLLLMYLLDILVELTDLCPEHFAATLEQIVYSMLQAFPLLTHFQRHSLVLLSDELFNENLNLRLQTLLLIVLFKRAHIEISQLIIITSHDSHLAG